MEIKSLLFCQYYYVCRSPSNTLLTLQFGPEETVRTLKPSVVRVIM